MAIRKEEGFFVNSLESVDTRILLSKADMLSVDPDSYPDVYFAFCTDDGLWYRFDYPFDDNGDPKWPEDPETGWFRKLDLSGNMGGETGSGPISERPDAGDGKPGDKWYDPTEGKTYIIVKDSEGNNQWVEQAPKAGEMMYDATNGKILYFDGTQWREVGGLNNTSVGTTAPSDPKPGDRWLDESQNPPVLKEWDGSQWKPVTAKEGDMMYDATNDVIMYFDGTQWKPIGGGVDKIETLPSTPEEGKIYYMNSEGQYMIYEDGVWLTLTKTWEGTQAQYTTLGGNAWSTSHPDVIIFITD